MKTKKLISSVALCGIVLAGSLLVRLPIDAANSESKTLRSQVIDWDASRVHRGDWGEMRIHFTGETLGTRNVLVATAVVQPGKSVHRAHRHAPEEYLIVTQGWGVWHLDGKEFPAEKGDMLYAEPWVYHGLTNTGGERLIFVVVRYNAIGVELPPQPDDRPNEL